MTPESMRMAPRSGPATSNASSVPASVSNVSTSSVVDRTLGRDLRLEGRAFTFVREDEGVRGGAGRGDVVQHAGGQIARRVKARDVGRAGGGDRRPFVRSP